jgi:hypothetical protein
MLCHYVTIVRPCVKKKEEEEKKRKEELGWDAAQWYSSGFNLQHWGGGTKKPNL